MRPRPVRAHRVLAALALVAAALAPGPASATSAATDSTFMLGADLSFLPQVEAAGAVFRDDAGAADALTLLARHGVGWVRLRLWNAPADGHSGLAEVLAMARRAHAQRMSILLDLHYSDTWADPGQQRPPAVWRGLPLKVLADSVRCFTRDVVAALAAQDTPPAMVQLGNEIIGGMLWDAGRVGGAYDTPAQWAALTRLLEAGARGVREGSPRARARVMLHLDRGGDAAACRWFLDHLVGTRVPFDAIGVSYYPWWHGSLEALEANLAALATRFGRDVVVVETAYPWTLEPLDATRDLVGLPAQLHAGYPASPEGQGRFLARLATVVRSTPGGHGRGVFLWAPEWVSAPRLGSGGENLALFDGSGALLPALDALARAAGLGPGAPRESDPPRIPDSHPDSPRRRGGDIRVP